MAIDMNADIGEILKGLFSRNTEKTVATSKENPYKNIILAGGGVVSVALLYLFIIFLPMQNEMSTKYEQVSQIGQLNFEIARLEQEVLLAKDSLIKRKSEFEQMSKRFLGRGDLGKLYRYISRLALTHKVLIDKLNKISEVPIFQLPPETDQNDFDFDMGMGDSDAEFDAPPPDMNADDLDAPKAVAYYRLLIQLDVSTNFLAWSRLKRDLAKLDKIIVIESEQIKLIKSKQEKGRVKVSLVLAAYRWPANDIEKYATEKNDDEGYY